MSTDIITGNDLKAILGEVLPASQGVFCELIWTNPNGHTNLTCTMGESTITIDKRLSKYDGFIVEFRNYYNAGDKTTEIYFSKCQGMYGRTIISATLSNPMISYGRHWYPVNSSNEFYFSDCTRYISNAASVVGSDTGCLVPMRIYGFKLYATLEQPLEVADYIVEQGTSDGWEYRKWNSGKYEAEKVDNIGTVSLSSVYFTIESNVKMLLCNAIPTSTPTPPHTLLSGYSILYEYLSNSTGYTFVIKTSADGKIQLARAGSEAISLSNVKLVYRILNGRWK